MWIILKLEKSSFSPYECSTDLTIGGTPPAPNWRHYGGRFLVLHVTHQPVRPCENLILQ
jgi:hypothetical protein